MCLFEDRVGAVPAHPAAVGATSGQGQLVSIKTRQIMNPSGPPDTHELPES